MNKHKRVFITCVYLVSMASSEVKKLNYRRLFFLICIIIFSIAAALDASVVISPFKGMSESLDIFILELGHESPQVQQRVAAAIKEMKVSDDQILLAWAKLTRLLSRGGIINYDLDHWLRTTDAVFRLIDLDKTSVGLLDTLKNDESVLALNSVIIQLGDENPQGQQHATVAIKEMKVNDDKVLLAWAEVTRLLHMGGVIIYDLDHWVRTRDAVFRLINLDKALAGLLDTLKNGNKDESILARYVIEEIDEKLKDSSIKPLSGTLPLLTKALEDQHTQIRETATQLLETISTHANVQERK